MSQTSKIVLAVIVTAIIVGGGVYYWQSQKTTESIIPKTSQADFALSIDQKPLGESAVTVRDTYNEMAGFSLHFPSSWGFVNVTKHNLTDGEGGDSLPQRASYTFKSEFRPHTHYFTVIISFAKDNGNSLVIQGNRIYVAEDKTYYYNYNPSTQYCVEEGKCKQTEVEGINAEIKEIIDSFKLL